MPLRVTMFFRSGKYTWTESHLNLTYSVLPTPSGGANNLQPPTYILDLAKFRVACLGVNAALFKVRLSLIPSTRLVLDYYAGYANLATTGTWPSTLDGLNPAYNAAPAGFGVVTYLAAAGGGKTLVYLAGCPIGAFGEDGIAGTGLTLNVCTNLLANLTAYIVYLCGGGQWGWDSRQGGVFSPAVGPPVATVGPPAGVGVVVGVPLSPAPVPGQLLLVRGWRRISTASPSLTGIYKLAAPPLATAGPPATTTYFLAPTSQVQPNNFSSRYGAIALYQPAYKAYAFGGSYEATTRKRGASAGAPRGRLRPGL